ncbi:GNAT family N-acetyltransferase [Delftia acidovorans]|uniref:GNAT family N-acetyltransferase n=2 Tax=Delftia acidovorans TaxID=80866 RepID=UPI0030EF253F
MVQAGMSKSFTHDRASVECDPERVVGVEQRGFNAWPAQRTVLCGDWLLRAAQGHTKRANSANAQQPGARLGALLPQIEAFYERQGLPAIFRLSPLASPEADAQLAQAGYLLADPSLVMRAALTDMAPPANDQGWTLAIQAQPGTAWLQGFAQAGAVPEQHRQAHHHMLQSIAWPAAFASLQVGGGVGGGAGGEVAGFGLAVVERGCVGLYDIVITPALRGQGLGRALVHGLMHWGQTQGAQWAELQVRAPNMVARGLYESLGFQALYGYHYRLPASAL